MPAVFPNPMPLFFGGTAVLEGRICDAETGERIPNARVFLTPAGVTDGRTGSGGLQPYREVYKTDLDGVFRINGLVDQRYSIDVEAPGYLNYLGLAKEAFSELFCAKQMDDFAPDWRVDALWDTRWTESHPAWHVLLTAFPQPCAGQGLNLEICLRRGRVLHGCVRSDGGKPIPGASVKITRQGIQGYHLAGNYWGERHFRPNRPTETDSGGAFRLTIHPRMGLAVRITAPGYIPAVREVDAVTLEGKLDVVLEPGTTLSGRILTELGQPPDREVHVSLFGLRVGSPILNGSTDVDGTFSFDGVPPAPVVMVAHNQHLGAAVKELASLTKSVEVRLIRPRLLKGRVIGHDSSPRPGAFIYQQIVIGTCAGEVRVVPPFFRHSGETVQQVPSGGLMVGIPLLATGSTYSHAGGSFAMQTILDQSGRVRVSASVERKSVSEADYAGSVEIKDDLVIRLPSRNKVGRGSQSPTILGVSVPTTSTMQRWKQHLNDAPKEDRRRLVTEIREAACRLSGGHPPSGESDRPDLVPILVAALQNNDPEVRSQAACALAYMNHSEAFAPLLEALWHADPTVRYCSVMGIEWIGRRANFQERAIAALRKKFDLPDDDFRVTLHVASSLVALKALEDPSIFLRALREDNANDALAAQALAALDRRDAIELMIERMRGSDLNHHLRLALQKLTGHDAGMEYADWRDWFKHNRGHFPSQLAIEPAPANAEGSYRRGLKQLELGHLERALEDFTHAIELDPTHAKALIQRARLRNRHKHDHRGAMRDYERALELRSNDLEAWKGLGWVRFLIGDFNGAITAASRAIEITPQDPDSWMARAKYNHRNNDRTQAIADAQMAIALGGDSWEDRATAERLLRHLQSDS
jgi:tetratricopeptide (TPR) repeat protein